MTKILNSVSQLNELAKELIDSALKRKEKTEGFFIYLKGDLGAGKTTLTKAIGLELGVIENMSSPTFVLQKNYKTKHNIFSTLVHIDAYRIEQHEEANILKIPSLIKSADTLVVIEWPERLDGLLPKRGIEVHIEHEGELQRKVTINFYE